jgi:hypothetical protein
MKSTAHQWLLAVKKAHFVTLKYIILSDFKVGGIMEKDGR